MKLIDRKGLYVLAILILSATTLSQTKALNVPETSSFAIEPGKMFSASTGKKAAKPKVSAIAPSTASLVSDIAEAIAVIKSKHSGDANADALAAASINEMLRSLDPHSKFYDRAKFAELRGEHQSEYYGTGLTIAEYDVEGKKAVYIIATTPNTSASEAKLRFGDRITAINGKAVEGLDSTAVRQLIRGPLGSTVQLRIDRADTLASEIVTLKRGRISQPTVADAFKLSEKTGYIALTGGFSFTTAAEFGAALEELKLSGIDSLVIDMRGNGGGIFEQAVEIAEYFLPAGAKIVSQRTRSDGNEQVWRSANHQPDTMPLVVIVDGGTASASEIVAGALQDNDRAVIVGERTFGKGLVQSVVELPTGSGIALTTARYYTPAGRSIQRDYADTGLYDYFKHTKQAAVIGSSENAVRTVTGRPVFGGDGIAPDVPVKQPPIVSNAIETHDLAFSFIRDAANGRNAYAGLSGQAFTEEIRRRILFGEDPVDDQMLNDFVNRYGRELDREVARRALRYNIGLAAFGFDGAERLRISDDLAVVTAVDSIPSSKVLFKAAADARGHKNTRRATTPAGINR